MPCGSDSCGLTQASVHPQAIRVQNCTDHEIIIEVQFKGSDEVYTKYIAAGAKFVVQKLKDDEGNHFPPNELRVTRSIQGVGNYTPVWTTYPVEVSRPTPILNIEVKVAPVPENEAPPPPLQTVYCWWENQ